MRTKAVANCAIAQIRYKLKSNINFYSIFVIFWYVWFACCCQSSFNDHIGWRKIIYMSMSILCFLLLLILIFVVVVVVFCDFVCRRKVFYYQRRVVAKQMDGRFGCKHFCDIGKSQPTSWVREWMGADGEPYSGCGCTPKKPHGLSTTVCSRISDGQLVENC